MQISDPKEARLRMVLTLTGSANRLEQRSVPLRIIQEPMQATGDRTPKGEICDGQAVMKRNTPEGNRAGREWAGNYF